MVCSNAVAVLLMLLSAFCNRSPAVLKLRSSFSRVSRLASRRSCGCSVCVMMVSVCWLLDAGSGLWCWCR